jgi:hypothetical protein
MIKTIVSVGVTMILIALLNGAEARGRSGACDGYNRCRCGVTAARYNGVAVNYNGFNLKRAVEWIRAFPRTMFQAGAVGYVSHGGPSGHVFTVVNGSNCASATVHDDKGTYQRNVCHATFVAVHGGGAFIAAKGAVPRVRHARSHHSHVRHASVRHHHVRMASFGHVPDKHEVH